MDVFTNLVLAPALISGLLTFLTIPLVIRSSKKLGIIDDPKKNKHIKVIHKYPVPRGGGIALFVGILISSLMFLQLDKHLIGILLGASLIVLLGFLDDKYDLSPYSRLFFQFIAASLPIIAGIGIAFITNPLNGIIDLSHPQINLFLLGQQRSLWIVSAGFGLLWLVTLMNFINIGASGLDGQLSGTVVIAATTIMLLSLRFSADITQWPVISLSAITMGAYLGFLPWHIYPQKIMPGFGGSTLAGFMLGILAILSTTKVGALLVVLAVPLVDTGFSVVRRVLSGKSPFWGDRGHLHHKLLDIGWSKPKVASFYWIITATLGAVALNLNASYKFYTIVGVTIFIGGLLLWLTQKRGK